jgi:hypothetical protein
MNQAFLGFLADRRLSVTTTAPLAVKTDSFDDCDKAGSAVAGFIAATPGNYALEFDGPGADSALYTLHTDRDTEVIAGTLATCAGLQ